MFLENNHNELARRIISSSRVLRQCMKEQKYRDKSKKKFNPIHSDQSQRFRNTGRFLHSKSDFKFEEVELFL